MTESINSNERKQDLLYPASLRRSGNSEMNKKGVKFSEDPFACPPSSKGLFEKIAQ
jgi:hypothetical protein